MFFSASLCDALFYNIGNCVSRNDVYFKIASLFLRPQSWLLSKAFLLYMKLCKAKKPDEHFCNEKGERKVENRVVLLGIVVENPDSVEKLNNILHKYSEYIIGRMGIPHRKRNISLISVAMDAPSDKISALSGSIGMIDGVSSKAIYSKIKDND